MENLQGERTVSVCIYFKCQELTADLIWSFLICLVIIRTLTLNSDVLFFGLHWLTFLHIRKYEIKKCDTVEVKFYGRVVLRVES